MRAEFGDANFNSSTGSSFKVRGDKAKLMGGEQGGW